VGSLSGGRLHTDIKERVGGAPSDEWQTYQNGRQEWSYLELGDRRKSWRRFRRAVFCRPMYEDRQRLLEFARPGTIIYTNIGIGDPVDDALVAAGNGPVHPFRHHRALPRLWIRRACPPRLQGLSRSASSRQGLPLEHRRVLRRAARLRPCRVVQGRRPAAGVRWPRHDTPAAYANPNRSDRGPRRIKEVSGISHGDGPRASPARIPTSDLIDRILAAARARPDAVATLEHGVRTTCRSLEHSLPAVAGVLEELGFGPEVPVGVELPLGADAVVAIIGVRSTVRRRYVRTDRSSLAGRPSSSPRQ